MHFSQIIATIASITIPVLYVPIRQAKIASKLTKIVAQPADNNDLLTHAEDVSRFDHSTTQLIDERGTMISPAPSMPKTATEDYLMKHE